MKPPLLDKAKAALILDQPFFASLLLSMPIVEDNSQPTLVTNGEEIRYNSEFMAKQTLQETIFLLAHETMHCVVQTMHRRGNRKPNKWNIASDYVINDMLIREKVGTMPEGGLHNPDLVALGKGTSEGVYDLLPDNPEGDVPTSGQPGGALDQVNDAGKDPAEMAEKEAEMRVKIVQAGNAAKACGKLSVGMARMVGEAKQTRTDWRAILRRFLSERAKVDPSYSKPKRRFLADDIYLPGLVGEKMGGVVIAVDCSASVSPSLLNAFAVEVKSICEDVKPGMTYVTYFDTAILRVDTFEADQPVEVKPHGGGGTAFSPIFRHVESNDWNPCAVVVLTDLECDDFGPSPSYPVLWASTEPGNAPFGEILSIRE